MKCRFGRRDGQTMVEYMIIIVLIAITLIFFIGKFSQATGKKIAGATSALDADIGSEAASEVDNISGDRIKDLKADGTF
jgi:Flp/Fap pilin component.